MKILIDNIVFSLQNSGGISVYWRELITRFLEKKSLNILFIEEKRANKNIFRETILINQESVINNKKSNFLFRYRDVKLDFKGDKFIFHSTYYRTLNKFVKRNNEVKEVVTVHDFTYEYYVKGLKKWIHIFQKRRALEVADVIICISENTKRDLLIFYPQFANKRIEVVYNGVADDYFPLKSSTDKLGNSDFFLFVGSRVSYKNFDFTVKAVSQSSSKHKLKIVGGALNAKELKLLNEFLPNRWEFFLHVKNQKLNELYNSCIALLYLSSYEGFGIPILEAMRAGSPFIAMNSSSIPEVAGNAGVLIDRLDFDEFNKALAIIELNRKEVVEKGLIRAEKFSWEICFQETLNIYKTLDLK
ncbi:glycosyltransferase family 4 protein [Flavobacterium fluviatile]|uniref:glycosyltransferase family 4 protein n=1 Tax=Flavobacterium fluviatile TaxID=1862387 RepID=UPI0013D89966|nr:glycosyltransferase family 1 protein [Flavobacterium fluviatile]